MTASGIHTRRLFGKTWFCSSDPKARALREAGYNPESHLPEGSTQRVVIALAIGQVVDNKYVSAGSNGYHYGTFLRIGELAQFLNWQGVRDVEGSRAFFEVLLQNQPLRVAFDLEYEFDKPRHAEVGKRLLGDSRDKADFLRAVLVRRVLPWISSLAGQPVTTTECQCLDASDDGKLSFHVVVDKVFVPAGSLDGFRHAVARELRDLFPLLDGGVYTSRPMRLVGCTKVGSRRCLLPVTSVGDVPFGATPAFDGTFTQELLERHMWTFVPPGAVALAGLGAPAPPPRGVNKPRSTRRGAAVGPEVLAALAPYLQRAGFTEHGQLVERETTRPAYFFNFGSAQTCPLCAERPHPNAGYSLAVWLQPNSTLGQVEIKAWSSGCKGLKKRVAPPLPLFTLGSEYPPLPNASLDPEPELERQLVQLLGGYDSDGTDLLRFRYLFLDGAWTLRTQQNWYARLFPHGAPDYCVHVEDGKARVVLTRGTHRFLVASFPAALVPPHLRSTRLSGVPFHEPDAFVPTLARYLGTVPKVAARMYDGADVPPDTTLLFQVATVDGPTRVCAVSRGRLCVREFIDRAACACCAPEDPGRCQTREPHWVHVDEADAVTHLSAAFERVYGQQLARLGAVPTAGGRCTLEVLNLTDVYPWHHAAAIARMDNEDAMA